MKQRIVTLAIAATVGMSFSPAMLAQGMKPGPGMMQNMQMHPNMMEMHQKMEAAWKQEDDDLQKLVDQMNKESGQAKVDALAAIVTRMLALRKEHHAEMAAMHQGMGMQRSMTSPMPASSPAATASASP